MNKPDNHLKLAYILVSLMMFLPVLLWPVPLVIFENPMLTNHLSVTWFLTIALLLLTAVSMDSILYGAISFKNAVDAMLWISLFAMITVSALQNQHNTWILAVLFFIHALRSGYRLWMMKHEQSHAWWLWLAWGRDTSSSLTILCWNIVLVY